MGNACSAFPNNDDSLFSPAFRNETVPIYLRIKNRKNIYDLMQQNSIDEYTIFGNFKVRLEEEEVYEVGGEKLETLGTSYEKKLEDNTSNKSSTSKENGITNLKEAPPLKPAEEVGCSESEISPSPDSIETTSELVSYQTNEDTEVVQEEACSIQLPVLLPTEQIDIVRTDSPVPSTSRRRSSCDSAETFFVDSGGQRSDREVDDNSIFKTELELKLLPEVLQDEPHLVEPCCQKEKRIKFDGEFVNDYDLVNQCRPLLAENRLIPRPVLTSRLSQSEPKREELSTDNEFGYTEFVGIKDWYDDFIFKICVDWSPKNLKSLCISRNDNVFPLPEFSTPIHQYQKTLKRLFMCNFSNILLDPKSAEDIMSGSKVEGNIEFHKKDGHSMGCLVLVICTKYLENLPARGDLVYMTYKKSVCELGYVENVDRSFLESTVDVFKISFKIKTMSVEKELYENQIVRVVTVFSLLKYLHTLRAIKNESKSPLYKNFAEIIPENYKMVQESGESAMPLLIRDFEDTNKLEIVAGISRTIGLRQGKICLIQCPPITDRLSLIVNIINRVKEANGMKILLTGPTDESIDEVVLKLLDIQKSFAKPVIKFNIVRLGLNERMNPGVRQLALSTLALGIEKDHTDPFCLKRKEEHTLEEKTLLNADIIASPASFCYSHKMESVFGGNKEHNIEACIVNNAERMKESETLIPLMLGVKTMVLVGDPQRPRPKTDKDKTSTSGLESSLFNRAEKVFRNKPNNPIVMLTNQYRIAESIAHWPSKYFYSGKLESPLGEDPVQDLCTYQVFEHDGKQDDCHRSSVEAKIVVTLTISIIETLLNTEAEDEIPSITIVTPYLKQKNMIIRLLKVTLNGGVEQAEDEVEEEEEPGRSESLERKPGFEDFERAKFNAFPWHCSVIKPNTEDSEEKDEDVVEYLDPESSDQINGKPEPEQIAPENVEIAIEQNNEEAAKMDDKEKDTSTPFKRLLAKVQVNLISESEKQEECDIIIMSSVKNQESLSFKKHFSYILMKARQTMIICGNFSTYRGDALWEDLVKDAKVRKVYRTINKRLKLIDAPKYLFESCGRRRRERRK